VSVQSEFEGLETREDGLVSAPLAGRLAKGSEAPFQETVLRAHKGWQPIDLGELWRGRELFGFLVWRDISIRYKQTLLGGLWAILQPLLAMLIFTIFFNRLAGIQGDGVPYPLFAYSGLVLWTFFANSITASSNSLVGNQVLVSKVYFPRIFIPLASIGAIALDLAVGFLLLIPMMIYYKWHIGLSMVFLPLFVFGTLLAASGLGLILSSMNVRFRDVKYVVPYFTQIGLFVSPVIYPLRYVPDRYRILLALNPMTGMISGFRAAVLGQPANWSLVWTSLGVSVGLFTMGLFVFRRMERRFADII
jgi:lipopolysaccharide transport system permease protein